MDGIWRIVTRGISVQIQICESEAQEEEAQGWQHMSVSGCGSLGYWIWRVSWWETPPGSYYIWFCLLCFANSIVKVTWRACSEEGQIPHRIAGTLLSL